MEEKPVSEPICEINVGQSDGKGLQGRVGVNKRPSFHQGEKFATERTKRVRCVMYRLSATPGSSLEKKHDRLDAVQFACNLHCADTV